MEKPKKLGDSAFGGESAKKAVKSEIEPGRHSPAGNRNG